MNWTKYLSPKQPGPLLVLAIWTAQKPNISLLKKDHLSPREFLLALNQTYHGKFMVEPANQQEDFAFSHDALLFTCVE